MSHIDQPSKPVLGLTISLIFHAGLFSFLAAMGNTNQSEIKPPQIIEVATLVLQSSPENMPASISEPVSPQSQTAPVPPTKPAQKTVEKPKRKSKPTLVSKPKRTVDETITEASNTGNEISTSVAPANIDNLTSTGSGSSSGSGDANTNQLVEADYRSAKLNNPPTTYPGIAVARGLEGVVELKVQVMSDGFPGEIQIYKSSGHKILDDSAMEQLRQWHFLPGRKGDQPITSWVRVPIKFRLIRR